MTPQEEKDVSDKLNTHTGQIFALQAVVLAITSRYEVDQNFVREIVEKTPLTGTADVQADIRAKSQEFVLGLIPRRVQ